MDERTKTSVTDAPACDAMTGTLNSIDAAGAMAAMQRKIIIGKLSIFLRNVLPDVSSTSLPTAFAPGIISCDSDDSDDVVIL